MTGRAVEFTLLPLSIEEIRSAIPITEKVFNELCLYGSYPRVVASPSVDDKLEAIKAIATNYLYKDIFMFEALRNPREFEVLVKALALQVGSLVSWNELAQTVGVSRATVEKYVRLLEQSFIVKIIYSYSVNPRTELKKAFKVFFLDVGIRNALVDIVTPLEDRNDKGGIFENVCVAERLKLASHFTFPPDITFWRSRTGAEVDIVEQYGQTLRAFECKWKPQHISFEAFLLKYPHATTEVLSSKTYTDKNDSSSA
jgi:uncharacterized protein